MNFAQDRMLLKITMFSDRFDLENNNNQDKFIEKMIFELFNYVIIMIAKEKGAKDKNLNRIVEIIKRKVYNKILLFICFSILIY